MSTNHIYSSNLSFKLKISNCLTNKAFLNKILKLKLNLNFSATVFLKTYKLNKKIIQTFYWDKTHKNVYFVKIYQQLFFGEMCKVSKNLR